MIDFSNGALFKLKEVDNEGMSKTVEPLLVPGEEVVASFKATRDYVRCCRRQLAPNGASGARPSNFLR